MQPYLVKMFQSVRALKLLKDSATYLISQDGEEAALKHCNFRGEVEDWFRALEESMRVSIRMHMKSSLYRYENDEVKRTDWLNESTS